MKMKFKLFGIYLPTVIAVIIATVVMRCVALFLQFDYDSGYFSNKILIGVSDSIVVASAIFFLTYILTAPRDISLIPNFTSPATYVPTGITIIAISFMTASLFKLSGETLNYIAFLKAYNSSQTARLIGPQRILFLMLILSAVFAILSIIHFAFTALSEKHSNTKRANFGICTVLFLSLYAMYLYFSTALPINSPNKTLDQMAYLLAAVFFLYETRLSFGREKWRPYIAFGFIASTVCAYSSIPSIILYISNGETVSNTIYESTLTLALFIFIISRIILTAGLIEAKSSPTVSAIAKAAHLRQNEINPISEIAEIIDLSGKALEYDEELPDENQITIDDAFVSEQSEEAEITETTEESIPCSESDVVSEDAQATDNQTDSTENHTEKSE